MASGKPEELRERIKTLYPELSPAMKKVAKLALDDPLEISLQPLRTLAERSGAGTTTLIRFAQLLGFESYGAFRDCFRSDLRQTSRGYSERGRALLGHSGTESLLSELQQDAIAGIDECLKTNPPAAIDAFAAKISTARSIYVIGLRSAYAPAFYLYYLLSLLRPGLRLVENRIGMLAEEIGDAGRDDVAIAISFDPYTKGTIETAQLLKEAGADVLAISDSSASPLAGIASDIIEVTTVSPSFYISFTPLMHVIEAVAALVAVRIGDKGVATLQRGDLAREKPGTYWNRIEKPGSKNRTSKAGGAAAAKGRSRNGPHRRGRH